MKKLGILLVIMVSLFVLTGCIKTEKFENVNILTTSYPIEYITERLYKENSRIKSIYPAGEDIEQVEFSEKELQDFAKNELYIYIGKIEKERELALKLKNLNKNLLLIDASRDIKTNSGIEEIWLDQSNMIMVVQNVADGLKEYMESSVLKKKVDKNFEELNVELSNLDAEIKITATNSDKKTIVVADNTLKFLKRYGFEVISLDEKEAGDHTVEIVKQLAQKEKIKYIFTLQGKKSNELLDNLLKQTNLKKITLNNLANITDEEKANNIKYPDMVNKFIEELKMDVY